MSVSKVVLPMLFFLFACTKIEEKPAITKLDIRISAEELDQFKTIILEGYEKYDAHLFSDKVNCFFRQFVENELHLYGQYYDTVIEGISIKHYSCPFNQLAFNVIRGSDGRFHYLGLSDIIKVESLIDSVYEYSDNHHEYNYKLNELELLPITMSNMVVLNKIMREDTLFKKKAGYSSLRTNLIKQELAEAFVYHNYKWRTAIMGRALVSVFSMGPPMATTTEWLVEMKESPLNDREKKLLTGFKNCSGHDYGCGLSVLNIPMYGLTAFELRHTDSAFQFRQYFVPKLRRYGMAGCDVTPWDSYTNICGQRP